MSTPAAFAGAGDAATLLQDEHQRRTELATDIAASSYLRGRFVLSSGRASSYYIDKYLFQTRPTILRRLASLLAEHVPAGVDRLAGPELGAVPLVTAVSLHTGLPFVIVRREAKNYATGRVVEGELHAGEQVLLLEDVLTTGAQALGAAARLREEGALVVGILAVLDREQGGIPAITGAGYHVDALFCRRDLPLRPSPSAEPEES
ncbi:MAG: orotate phosphoribosyltransferase [Actinomycetes bacterium]